MVFQIQRKHLVPVYMYFYESIIFFHWLSIARMWYVDSFACVAGTDVAGMVVSLEQSLDGLPPATVTLVLLVLVGEGSS